MANICSIKNGKSNSVDATDDGEYAFFDRSKKIKKSARYLYDCEALIIPGEGAEFLPRHFIGKFDLHQRAYALFDFIEDIEVKFLYYYLIYNKDYFVKVAVGATVKSLRLRHFEQLPVPVPPIEVQRRIVAILDEAVAGIVTATANAEKNLQNARELFESTLQSVFAEKGEGWVETNLGSLADFKNGLNFSKRSRGETIKIVGVRDFQSNYWVPMDELANVQIDGELPDAYVLHKGDILAVRSNGNKNLIGRCILAGDVPEITSHSGFTIRIRVKSEDVAPDFLVHYLKSETVRQLLIDSGGGANISSLNQTALANLPVLLPSREEQATIVFRIVKLEQEKDKLMTLYQSKLDALEELKQSFLQKAFAGELQ